MAHYVMFNRPKYNNRKTEYHGTSYMSNKEATKAWELDQLKKSGKIKDWKKQVKLSLDVNGKHICNYFMDFVIYEKDGGITYCEIKSPITQTPVWRVKWKLAQALITDPNITWVVEM